MHTVVFDSPWGYEIFIFKTLGPLGHFYTVVVDPVDNIIPHFIPELQSLCETIKHFTGFGVFTSIKKVHEAVDIQFAAFFLQFKSYYAITKWYRWWVTYNAELVELGYRY